MSEETYRKRDNVGGTQASIRAAVSHKAQSKPLGMTLLEQAAGYEESRAQEYHQRWLEVVARQKAARLRA